MLASYFYDGIGEFWKYLVSVVGGIIKDVSDVFFLDDVVQAKEAEDSTVHQQKR